MDPYEQYKTVNIDESTDFLIEQKEFLSTVGAYAPPNFSQALASKLLIEVNAVLAKRGVT